MDEITGNLAPHNTSPRASRTTLNLVEQAYEEPVYKIKEKKQLHINAMSDGVYEGCIELLIENQSN